MLLRGYWKNKLEIFTHKCNSLGLDKGCVIWAKGREFAVDE